MPGADSADIFEYLLRLGDDALVLGHRLSEWCAYAPALEEDLALANIALDCLGQGAALLGLAAEVEGANRTADALAYFRSPHEFRNLLLMELPHHHDFALTIARQVLVDSYRYLLFESLQQSTAPGLAGIAAKSVKEVTYHLRHSSSWIIRLGDGTDESKSRITAALGELFPYTAEFFVDDELESRLAVKGIAVSRARLKPKWNEMLGEICHQAALTIPEAVPAGVSQGWCGNHTEHLTTMLDEMQSLARAHPNASW